MPKTIGLSSVHLLNSVADKWPYLIIPLLPKIRPEMGSRSFK